MVGRVAASSGDLMHLAAAVAKQAVGVLEAVSCDEPACSVDAEPHCCEGWVRSADAGESLGSGGPTLTAGVAATADSGELIWTVDVATVGFLGLRCEGCVERKNEVVLHSNSHPFRSL